jgi:hypothetical protein
MSRSDRHENLVFDVAVFFFLSLCNLMAAFRVRILGILSKINLDQTVGIYGSNPNCRGKAFKVNDKKNVRTINVTLGLYCVTTEKLECNVFNDAASC